MLHLKKNCHRNCEMEIFTMFLVFVRYMDITYLVLPASLQNRYYYPQLEKTSLILRMNKKLAHNHRMSKWWVQRWELLLSEPQSHALSFPPCKAISCFNKMSHRWKIGSLNIRQTILNIKCNTTLLLVNSKTRYRKDRNETSLGGGVCWGDGGYSEGRWCNRLLLLTQMCRAMVNINRQSQSAIPFVN